MWRSILKISLVLLMTAAGLEAYTPLDHSHAALDSLLAKHVSAGRVDYAALAAENKALQNYINAIGGIAPGEKRSFSREESLALYINAFNAFTLDVVLGKYPVASVTEIEDPWGRQSFRLVGELLTLEQLERRRIFAQYKEPLAHMALARASLGAPALRSRAWTAASLEEDLAAAARDFARNERLNRLDRKNSVLHVSWLFDVYGKDFESRFGGSVLPGAGDDNLRKRAIVGFFIRYGDSEMAEFLKTQPVTIRFMEADWRLNDREIADAGD